MRRLVISGETWHWRYGHYIDIRDPQGKGHRVSLAKLLGTDWDGVERADNKGYLRVEPSVIVDHIQRNILGYDDVAGYPKGVVGHRTQAAIRKGWTSFCGPRGQWQAQCSPWIVKFHSPEDVVYEARAYTILGMSVDEWMDIKAADLAAIGSSFDAMWMAERQKPADQQTPRIQLTMEYDAPSMPKPTQRQLEDYVMRHIAGAAAMKTMRNAA